VGAFSEMGTAYVSSTMCMQNFLYIITGIHLRIWFEHWDIGVIVSIIIYLWMYPDKETIAFNCDSKRKGLVAAPCCYFTPRSMQPCGVRADMRLLSHSHLGRTTGTELLLFGKSTCGVSNISGMHQPVIAGMRKMHSYMVVQLGSKDTCGT
jgi:hypothetical protein